ncbi:hypothetical protein PIB30_033081 [Stylosanthes scabra]|uniref:Uncharacterized protein n=1 Tax=Stylosanthes scabra TaxID=79078 RepID=A0ABU6QCR3_9FABA|nr:hypothetical protein [Stylosanthes scabra]
MAQNQAESSRVKLTEIDKGENVNPKIASGEGIVGEDTVSEARKIKEVCEVGGISFKSREENVVLGVIAGTKSPKKVIGSTPKKQKQGRPTQSVGGRNLFSKLLRGLGSDGKVEMVKRVRRKFNGEFLGLIETKKQQLERGLALKLWGGGSGIKWDWIES